MALPVSGVPTETPAAQVPELGSSRGLGRFGRAVRLNRKATVGSVLLLIFILIALFPGVIAHDSPTQDAYAPQLGVSTAHLLGTNHYGQDLFAQLVYGTRNVLIIAFVVGLATTTIAVLIGVAAAYLGGVTDSSLNVVTDVLLVIPLFPLLIVIAAYAHGGTTLVLIATIGTWILTMRNTMITTLAEDYVRMARAKGLPNRRIMFDYAARNAILPNLTGFAMSLGFVVSGAILIEYVFNYPGVGYMLLQAVSGEDYPLMQGLFLLITVAVLFAILVADILTALLDPRTRAEG